MKILMLIWLSYRLFQLCWLLSLEQLSCFEHTVQSLQSNCLFRTRSGATPNHTLLKYWCPNQSSNQIRYVCLTSHYLFSTRMLHSECRGFGGCKRIISFLCWVTLGKWRRTPNFIMSLFSSIFERPCLDSEWECPHFANNEDSKNRGHGH